MAYVWEASGRLTIIKSYQSQGTMNRIFPVVIVLTAMLIGCATVPKDVVRLSDQVGKDLSALYVSYDLLIHEFYNQLRSERVAYLDEIWYPRFIQNWMEAGEVQAIAAGVKVWSDEEERLVPVSAETSSDETIRTMRDWLDYALYAYEVKKDSLLVPLNREEEALRRDVNHAFRQVMRANATVTAHLNSIRKVKSVQGEALTALNIKELRDRIISSLANASERAEEALKRIREKDEQSATLMGHLQQ
jgi:hypothetical protein